MIFFVWSLVSSAIEAARKRQIANFLRVILAQQRVTRSYEMLFWKTNKIEKRSSSNRLYRPNSEPKLDSSLVFQNDLVQVFSERFETLRVNEWRFCPSLWPCDEDSIYFVVYDELEITFNNSNDNDQQEKEDVLTPNYFKLHEKCDRLAVHKTQTRSLYACSFQMFIEVVDSFSEHFLLDEHFTVVQICSMFVPPQEMNGKQRKMRASQMTSSMLSLTSTSQEVGIYSSNQEHETFQRPLPILQHLFWGDLSSNYLVGCSSSEKFASHENLDKSELMKSPRKSRHLSATQSNSIPNRRRYHSCNSPDNPESPEISNSPKFFVNEEFRSLPRYIRGYSNSPRNSLFNSDCEEFPRYIKQLNQNMSSEDMNRSIVPVSTTNSESFSSEISEKTSRMTEELRMIDETDSETIDSNRIIEDTPKTSFAILTKRENSGGVSINIENDEEFEKNTINNRNCTPYPNDDTSQNGTTDRSNESMTLELTKPPIATRNKRSTSVVPAKFERSNQRRFSAFPEADRGRSASPSSFEYFQNRSLRGFTSAATNRSNSSSRSATTPIRSFLIARNSSFKAMAKPDSVLVYTAGDTKLYTAIRHRLNSLLPQDEITVFNVSIEAIRKQPWNEKSTVCMILASTNELDDAAWKKIQEYFNNNGKIIFVCQNKLLASITGCDSSKENASILRFAFDNKTSKLKETNKDFTKFLQKNLKVLQKTTKINETFKTPGGASFSVALKRDENSPLFLYMQNSGCLHASALFSDATTAQLLAPNSNLLRDSLQGVGIKVAENILPALTKGIMMAEFDSIIDGISGLRLGEEIGTSPKILLRKSEIVEEQGLPDVSPDLLPIEVMQNEAQCSGFNFGEYFDNLTSKIGQVVVVVDIATTTMDICDSLNNAIPSLPNIVVIANRQISGRGRGGNEFISPIGSALFNFSFTIPKSSSRFSKCIPILQHVFCVSLVEAARNVSGCDDFPLRIKWPNDLYFERSHKVGGMLITCKQRDDAFLVAIGCGINVSNEKPTICLNDMLPSDSKIKNTITREKLIAETLNRFQFYLNDYEAHGPDNFRRKYYEYWLHSQQEVLLSDFNERVTIRGIDEYGYLQVRSKSNPDKIFSIGDDGNTFDMMKGLIRHKF